MIHKLIIEIQDKPTGFGLGNFMIAKDGVWLDSMNFWGKNLFEILDQRMMAALEVASAWEDYGCILVKVNSRGICLIQSDSDSRLDGFTNPVYNISPEEAYRRIEEAYLICSVHDS